MTLTSKGMAKRTLTGVAAASIALGMMAPASFAATAAWNYNSRTITIGNYSKNVGGIVAQDKSHFTEFIPVYYVMQGLQTLGYTVTWNGNTQVLNITTPSGVVPNFRNLNPGSDGTTKIEVNGTVVQYAPRVVAKDQLTGVMTTFMPIYYLNEALNVVGVANTYNGKTWTLTQSQVSTAPKLGNITLAGQQSGTGTSSSPAISNGASVSATAMLTDAYGNPVTGVDLTLLVMGSSQPTVTSSGQTLSGSTISGGYSYQIPTNASGQAAAQLTVPTGVAGSYTLQYQAPYTQSGSNITDSVAYVTFMSAYSMAITPFATSTSPYMASVSSVSSEAAGAVPVTVTLPLLNGQPQANAPVTFTLSGAGAFFSNAQGQSYSTGTGATVNTNSQGQATVYVNSDQTGSATVTATSGSLSPVSTYISWGQAGVASTLANLSATNVTGGTTSAWTASNGGDVTVTGTLEDALGNPVADAQLLVANQGGNSSYVNGTTTTAFPNAMPATAALVSSTGAPYGTMVTTNSAGAFSVTLTGSGVTGTYSLWTVQNGEVGNELGSPFTIAYKGSTSAISSVGVSIANQQAQSFNNNSDAPVTTMPSTQYSMTTGGVLEVAAYNSQPGDYLFGNPNASVSYTVTGASNGYIKSIDGVMMNGSIGGLPNDPTSVGVMLQPTMTVSAGQPAQVYKVLVNNVPIGTETVTYALPTGSGTPSGVTSVGLGTLGNASGNMTGFAVPSDLGQWLGSPSNGVYSDGNLVDAVNVGVGDSTAGTASFTFTSNSASATAASTFTGGAAAQVAAVSPQASSINPGQTETVTFTLEDSSGNPVPNSLAKVTSDGSTSNLWITQVNGQPLQQSEQIGSNIATMPTPFPLFAANGSLPSGDALGYTSVNVPNVANGILPTASSPGSTINVYTNSNGQFTLTFAAGSVSAFVTSGGVGQPQPQISSTAYSGLTANFFTNSTGVVSNVNTNVYVTTSTLTGNTNVGTLAW